MNVAVVAFALALAAPGHPSPPTFAFVTGTVSGDPPRGFVCIYGAFPEGVPVLLLGGGRSAKTCLAVTGPTAAPDAGAVDVCTTVVATGTGCDELPLAAVGVGRAEYRSVALARVTAPEAIARVASAVRGARVLDELVAHAPAELKPDAPFAIPDPPVEVLSVGDEGPVLARFSLLVEGGGAPEPGPVVVLEHGRATRAFGPSRAAAVAFVLDGETYLWTTAAGYESGVLDDRIYVVRHGSLALVRATYERSD